jgi:hypothetical protein
VAQYLSAQCVSRNEGDLGTYPNNLGHTDFDGCFRCHDDQHAAKDGKAITQDCSACHNLLATDEKNPKILSESGSAYKGKIKSRQNCRTPVDCNCAFTGSAA